MEDFGVGGEYLERRRSMISRLVGSTRAFSDFPRTSTSAGAT